MISIIETNQLILIILSIGLFISTMEYIKKIQIFSATGLLSWNVMQLRWEKKDYNSFFSPLFKLFNEKGLAVIFALRCVIIIGLIFFPLESTYGWILVGLLGCSLLASSMITFYGSDGSDQMNMLIIITLFLCHFPLGSGSRLATIGLWFIGLQTCLSYTVAGIAKLASAEWRASTAIKDVFSTKTYGSQWAALLMKKYPGLNVFLCWNVMIMETLFPLCLILPFNYALVFIIWGFLFHLFTAIIMGLNSFFWAFMAAYPALFFINHQIQAYLY
ncbi:hypothetical protein HDE69_002293 [Pedobacter cryoconitis]|uniref:HTTM domain-containing protein n=1 Tax=Pedobacter cryoconitis TaxID=188932 RepID=A0A7W8YTH7_9SPHI|nr:hypothetical protein [Pedobacter cryoconitis]MBB5621240.1 hypothetical protein [Pedobacter cryoconitis]MBB5645449.1 hypothetical protein [Pedobacter cryoconitis]